MKLLLDANLSWRLIKNLKHLDFDCLHVDNCGLQIPAKDIEIWEYALKNEYTIVTNDEDFLLLTLTKGYPPKIILIKLGNSTNKGILDLFNRRKEEINAFSKNENLGVLEIYK